MTIAISARRMSTCLVVLGLAVLGLSVSASASIAFKTKALPIPGFPGTGDILGAGASFVEGTVRVGTTYKQGRKTISYITMPTKCPKGGFPAKVEVSFLGGTIAEASYKMPCPKR